MTDSPKGGFRDFAAPAILYKSSEYLIHKTRMQNLDIIANSPKPPDAMELWEKSKTQAQHKKYKAHQTISQIPMCKTKTTPTKAPSVDTGERTGGEEENKTTYQHGSSCKCPSPTSHRPLLLAGHCLKRRHLSTRFISTTKEKRKISRLNFYQRSARSATLRKASNDFSTTSPSHLGAGLPLTEAECHLHRLFVESNWHKQALLVSR